MKKFTLATIFILLSMLVAIYAVKKDIHVKILGEGKITKFIDSFRNRGGGAVYNLDQVGKQAPDFSLPNTKGGQLKLSNYKGKLVLLNFWASWCPPCRAEIPGFITVQNTYQDKSFTFLGVAIEDKKAADSYAKDIGINYPISYGLENSLEVAGKYGNPDGGLPYSILISPEQKILSVYSGFLSEDKLKEIIEKNLP